MAISSHCCSPWLSSPARSSARSISRNRSSRPLTSPSSAAARGRQQQPGEAFARLCGQQDVVVDRQLRQHRGDLEFEAEAGAGALVGRGARDVLALEHDAAAVGEMGAGDRLEERALARPVGTDQAVERAGLHVDVDAVQRAQRAKRLADAADLQQRHPRHPPRRRRPYDPMRSRSDTSRPRMPLGWNITTVSSTRPRITGQNCLIASMSAST